MFDINDFMKELATKRPVFHSEADFQHAFAWQFHEHYPSANIRLELPARVDGKSIYVDIWISFDEGNLAIELKYKTLLRETNHNGEIFNLKNQGAQDLGRYDFLKDITRLEGIKNERAVDGYAIFLTNDSQYWNEGNGRTVDKNFRLHNTRILNGDLSWNGTPGDGTTKGRERVLTISGNYLCNWLSYSLVSDDQFRYLALKI